MATNEELVNGIRRLIRRPMSVRRPSSRKILGYHGSAYDFDNFDFDHIGTGEGNRMYGYGMYFAGDEGIADNYRKVTAALNQTPEQYAMELWRRNSAGASPDEGLQRALQSVNESLEEAAAEGSKPPYMEAALQKLMSIDPRGTFPKRAGHMYEVQLNVPQRSLLDWDAPISQQPRTIKRLYGDFALNRPGDGERIYKDAVARLGEGFDDDATGVLAARAASQELLDAGIPGIKYFDGKSRWRGYGADASASPFPPSSPVSNHNYLMFPGTEDQIRILRKYGIAAPATAGAGALQQDE